ncbi:MAG: hypothetical protein J6A22_05650 [Bacteroidales bacterium]|nr:hypothetical protein [Bacteroidales bacterium]
MKINGKMIYWTVTAIMVVAVLAVAIYIMVNRLGLVEGYDFGGGAYYYVDIPGFDDIVKEDAFITSVPVWVHAVLFIVWGWLMWRLWLWIDRKTR